MPADRPRTAAQARAVAATADDDDGLAAAWQPEEPPARWRDCLGPEASPCQCGQPRRWTGAHTALVCIGRSHERPIWSVSPGAKARAAEHLAAIDNSAARKSAQLADPEAERIAADTFEARRAELLDDLDGLADDFDVRGFPRGDPEYGPARRAGLWFGAIVGRYRERVRQADTLDQLDRIESDAEKSLASAAGDGGWLDRITDLRDQLGQGNGEVIRGEVIHDDDQADEYAPDPIRDRAAADRRAGITAAWHGAPPADALSPAVGPWCEWCRRERRYVGDTYPLAVARVEAPGMVPAPVDVCADHLAEARRQYGTGLSVQDQFWAAFDTAATGRARAAGLAQLSAQSPYGGRPA